MISLNSSRSTFLLTSFTRTPAPQPLMSMTKTMPMNWDITKMERNGPSQMNKSKSSGIVKSMRYCARESVYESKAMKNPPRHPFR